MVKEVDETRIGFMWVIALNQIVSLLKNGYTHVRDEGKSMEMFEFLEKRRKFHKSRPFSQIRDEILAAVGEPKLESSPQPKEEVVKPTIAHNVIKKSKVHKVVFTPEPPKTDELEYSKREKYEFNDSDKHRLVFQEGDVFDYLKQSGEDAVLVHCISSDAKQTAGFAAILRDIVYVDLFKRFTGPAGTARFLGNKVIGWDHGIIAMVTKQQYNQTPTLESFTDALFNAIQIINELKISKVFSPAIGTGLDKLPRDVVLIRIQEMMHYVTVPDFKWTWVDLPNKQNVVTPLVGFYGTYVSRASLDNEIIKPTDGFDLNDGIFFATNYDCSECLKFLRPEYDYELRSSKMWKSIDLSQYLVFGNEDLITGVCDNCLKLYGVTGPSIALTLDANRSGSYHAESDHHEMKIVFSPNVKNQLSNERVVTQFNASINGLIRKNVQWGILEELAVTDELKTYVSEKNLSNVLGKILDFNLVKSEPDRVVDDDISLLAALDNGDSPFNDDDDENDGPSSPLQNVIVESDHVDGIFKTNSDHAKSKISNSYIFTTNKTVIECEQFDKLVNITPDYNVKYKNKSYKMNAQFLASKIAACPDETFSLEFKTGVGNIQATALIEMLAITDRVSRQNIEYEYGYHLHMWLSFYLIKQEFPYQMEITVDLTEETITITKMK